jgi:hypothetical protein
VRRFHQEVDLQSGKREGNLAYVVCVEQYAKVRDFDESQGSHDPATKHV